MRITFLNQFYLPDLAPTAHLLASLAEHRAGRGDQVQVVTSAGGYVAHAGEATGRTLPNLRIRRMWTPKLGKSRHLFRLIDYASFYLATAITMLFMRRQDVIVALTTPPLIGLTAALHKLLHPRCRLILWNMDCYPDVLEAAEVIAKGGIASRVLRWLTRLEFRAVDHLVTLDSAMTDLLLSQYAPKRSELPSTVIPNWERAELFPATPPATAWEGTERLGLEDKLVVLYLGNTGYGHRFDTVIEAARQLRDEPVTFLFIGGGKRWQELAAARNEHQLDNLILHDYVAKEATPAVMQQAHCALITLHDWSLGIMSPSKLHANLAMGLPVIYVGPAGSNVDEAVTHHQCGVSLRHGDTTGLVDFLRNSLGDRQSLANLGRQARLAFESHYCDTVTLPQFDAVIDAGKSGR